MRAFRQCALFFVSWICLSASGAEMALAQVVGPTGPASGPAPDTSLVGSPIGLLTGARLYPNWSDVPFMLSVTGSEGYNDNFLSLPNNTAPPTGATRGALFTTTLIDASSKTYIRGQEQELDFDANYGFVHYAHNENFDTQNYAINLTDHWIATSTCSGTIAATLSETQQPQGQLLVPGINSVTTRSLAETSQCHMFGHWSSVLNAGVSTNQNSQAVSSANSYTSYSFSGGFQYMDDLNTLRATTTITNNSFTNRASSVLASGLATKLVQIDNTLAYTRQISSKLTFNGSGGFTLATVPSSGNSSSSTVVTPIYSVGLTWAYSPKLFMTASISSSVTPPTSVLANSQLTRGESFQLTYLLTPKINVTAGVSLNSASASAGAATLDAGLSSQGSLTAFAKGVYTITPFLSGSLSYQHFETRSGASYLVTGNTFVVGLSYQPR